MADGKVVIETGLDTAGVERGLSKISGLAVTGLQATAAVIAGVGTALLGVGGYAVKTGSDFEASMSNVQAISGATAGEVNALTEKAKEMGAKTKFSASESADAFSYMAMAGWKTEDMLDGIDGIMNLAAASGADLATTSDIVTDALTAFGLSAEDSSRFADVMAAASSNANTNVEMMGETFKYVAPVAGALGFSAEDTAVAIGLMANSGIKGSQAGTALRSMMSRLAKPTDEVQAAMDDLGVSLTDSHGNMKSLDEIMGDLRSGFSGLSEAEQAEMASSLAGQEAMSGLLAIVNASDEDFGKLKDSIYNCDGAAEQMADTMQDNLQGSVTIMKSALEGLGIEIYDEIKDPLRNAVDEGTDAIGELTDALANGGIEGAVEKAGDIIADLAVKIAQSAPSMVESSAKLVQSFLTGISQNKKQLQSAAKEIVNALCDGLVNLLPKKMQEPVKKALDSLKRTFETGTKNLLSVGKSTIEALGKVFEWLADHMDAVLPIVTTLVAGFKTFQAVSGPVQSVVSVFTNLKTVSNDTGIAMGALNAIMNANPAVLIAAGIAVLVAGLAAYITTANRADAEQEAFNQKMDELGASIENTQNDLDALKESMKNTSSSIEASSAPIENWQSKLNDCFDSTGKVKEGCEDMAEYILNQLNEAMGTSYKLTADGFIKNNDGVKQSLDDVNKKIDEYVQQLKQKSLQEATANQYTEAIQKQGEAQADLNEAQDAYNKSMDEYAKVLKDWQDGIHDGEGLEKAQENLEKTKEKLSEASKACVDAGTEVSGLDAVMSKLAEGTPESVQEALTMYSQIPSEAKGAANGVKYSQEIIQQALGSTDYNVMAQGFQMAYEQIEESGGQIPTSLRGTILQAINEVDRLGPEGKESMAAAMAAIAGGMQDKIPEFENVAGMGSDEIINTFRQYLVDSGALEGTGSEAVAALSNGELAGKEGAVSTSKEVVESAVDGAVQAAQEGKGKLNAAGSDSMSGLSEGEASVDTTTVPAQKVQEATDSATTTLEAGAPQIQQGASNNAAEINTGYATTDVTSAASAAGNDSVQALISAITSLNATVQQATAGIGSSASKGLNSVNMGSSFGQQGTTAATQMTQGILRGRGTASSAASAVGKAVVSAFKGVNIGTNFQTQGKMAVTQFSAAIRGQTSAAVSAARALGTGAANALKGCNLPSTATSIGRQFATSFSSGIRGETSSAGSAAGALGNAARSALSNYAGVGRGIGAQFSASFSSGIRGQASSAGSAAGTIGNTARSTLAGYAGVGHSIGVQFSNGFAGGIRAGVGGVAAAAAAVANSAAAAAKANLQIHSPSRVGGYIGKMFDKGIEGGVEKNVSGIENAVEGITDRMRISPSSLLDSMKGAFDSTVTRISTNMTRQAPTVSKEYDSQENNKRMADYLIKGFKKVVESQGDTVITWRDRELARMYKEVVPV